jgi:hypothetical protein
MDQMGYFCGFVYDIPDPNLWHVFSDIKMITLVNSPAVDFMNSFKSWQLCNNTTDSPVGEHEGKLPDHH